VLDADLKNSGWPWLILVGVILLLLWSQNHPILLLWLHTPQSRAVWPSLRTRRTSPRKPVAKMELLIQDWATNPHIVTDLDLSQPANHPDVGSNTLREKYLDGRVQFAVSEVSERSPGLIEGALAIGESTAFDFLRTIV